MQTWLTGSAATSPDPLGRISRTVPATMVVGRCDQQAVNRMLVEFVDLEAVGMLVGVLERVLDAIDLVAQTVGLGQTVRQISRHDVEPARIHVEQRCVVRALFSDLRRARGGQFRGNNISHDQLLDLGEPPGPAVAIDPRLSPWQGCFAWP